MHASKNVAENVPRQSSHTGGIALHLAHDVERAAQQVLGGLRGAEGGVGRQGDIVEAGERIVGLDRLGMEHVEPGAADAPRRQRLDQPRYSPFEFCAGN
jgi:hypothetical protein